MLCTGEEVGLETNPAQCPLCSGLQALGQTFGANPAFASSLRYLDLSKNAGLLATDESNVSPQTVASSPYRSTVRRLQSLGSLPCSLGVEGLYHACPCPSFPGPVQFPGPAQCPRAPRPGGDRLCH